MHSHVFRQQSLSLSWLLVTSSRHIKSFKDQFLLSFKRMILLYQKMFLESSIFIIPSTCWCKEQISLCYLTNLLHIIEFLQNLFHNCLFNSWIDFENILHHYMSYKISLNLSIIIALINYILYIMSLSPFLNL